MDGSDNRLKYYLLGVAVAASASAIHIFFEGSTILDRHLIAAGRALVNGEIPYSDFSFSGAPGAIFIYAAVYWIFGAGAFGYLLLEMIWRTAAAMTVFLMADRYWGRLAGAAASTATIIVSIIASKYIVATPIMLSVLPLAGGLYFYRSEKIGSTGASGICMGIASLIFFPILPIVAALVVYSALKRRDSWEPRPRRSKTLSFLYGVIIVYSMLIFYLMLSLAMDDFVRQITFF